MNKTEAFQLFDEHFPPPVAVRAKRNFDEQYFANNYYSYIGVPPAALAVNFAFSWSGTPEGALFWSRVHVTARGYDHEYPSVKGLPT